MSEILKPLTDLVAESNGSYPLPGGLTLHWGTFDAPAGNTTGMVVPDVKNQILWCLGNVGTPTGSSSYHIGVSTVAGQPSQIQIQNTDSVAHGVYWMAISK